MRPIKTFVKKVLGEQFPGMYRVLHGIYRRFKQSDTEKVFADIFINKKWGATGSVSGPGSSPDQTKVLIGELPTLFRDLGISTIMDIPCGDFHWMRHVNLENISYVGAEIIGKLIRKNKKKHEKENIHFRKLNLIKDELPKVDLIICRDCLVHFSFEDVFLALNNICHSKSTYLLTTTFALRTSNHDILTGQWRTLNLVISPFNLPHPFRVINEGCTEGNGAYSDKSLGLWRIEDISESLKGKLRE